MFKKVFTLSFTLTLLLCITGCFLINPNSHNLTEEDLNFTLISLTGGSVKIGNDTQTASTNGAYKLAATETTWKLWNTVKVWSETQGYSYLSGSGRMGSREDGAGMTELQPVTYLSWRDAIVWCNALTEAWNEVYDTQLTYCYLTGVSPVKQAGSATDWDQFTYNSAASGFRLPTSIEWEYAARFVTDTLSDGDITSTGEYYPYNHASGSDYRINPSNSMATSLGISGDLDNDSMNEDFADVAVFNSANTSVVGSKRPTPLGFYAMNGNVKEFCVDEDLANTPPQASPWRVVRGGALEPLNLLARLQVSYPFFVHPEIQSQDNGFRIAQNL